MSAWNVSWEISKGENTSAPSQWFSPGLALMNHPPHSKQVGVGAPAVAHLDSGEWQDDRVSSEVR